MIGLVAALLIGLHEQEKVNKRGKIRNLISDTKALWRHATILIVLLI
jgi:hypothetical protein